MAATKCGRGQSAIVIAFAVSVVSATPLAQSSRAEQDVRTAVEAFYAAFNGHSFDTVPVTDTWEHINPLGGTARGRTTVLKELREVHSTFLKDAHQWVDNVAIRFPTPDIAIAVATGHGKTIVTPDGIRHENPRSIQTFVLVQKSGRWLIEHDQNTWITPTNP
jgi:uncharacterized protein (TIGR02246 family)